MTTLIRLTLAWLIGIVLAQWLEPPWPAVALAGLPAVGALLLYRENHHARLWAGMGLTLVAGAARLLSAQPTFDQTHIAFYNDAPAPITITGLVVDEPDTRDYYQNLRLRVERLDAPEPRPVEGVILVRAPRYPAHFYGERLQVAGRLETPPVFDDFSYKDYLARAGIHAMIRRPQIELVAAEQGHPFWAGMFAFKARASAAINRILAEPYAALLNGILLGVETSIPRDLYELFNLTGTSHIIVISGSNISLVAGIFLLLGQKSVGKRYTPPLAIGGIIFYTFLVGADSAVSRAAVMGIIWAVAIWVGRPGLALNTLFASGWVLSLINPLILGDVGFQLSFVATLGLILPVPPLERFFFGLLQRWLNTQQVGLAMALLSELLIVTLAAQISTGPLVIYHFGRLSLVSLLTNLLILPVQPAIMIVGGVAMLAGMVWLPLGEVLGWLVWLPLAWMVWVVEVTAGLPYAALDFGEVPLWLVGLLYGVIGAGVWAAEQPQGDDGGRPAFRLPRLGSPTTLLVVAGLSVAALLLWLAVLARPDGRLHVVFLDVGQGDAILITTPEGRQMLVDGGPSTTTLNWRLGQEMPFWDHSLDVVAVTHPDADHLAGLLSLPGRYEIGQVLMSVPGETALYQEWVAQLAEAQLTPATGTAGMRLSLGKGITATILSPPPDGADGGDKLNNHSLVLRLEYGQISFLLPGDIEQPVERRLVGEAAPLAATVLKVPHHGSSTSSSRSFLTAVDPQLCVISVGQENLFGHPTTETLARLAAQGCDLLQTAEQGTIEFSTDGQRLWVETTR